LRRHRGRAPRLVRGRGGLRGRRAGRLTDHAPDVVVRLGDDADERAHRGLLAGGDEDLPEHAAAERFHLHVGLVRLDLGEDVTTLHAVAFLFDPLDDLAGLHRLGELRHLDLGHGHGQLPFA
jgi:hypothetical protein